MIEFHALALRELRAAQAWYRERSPMAAERFFEQTNRVLDRILADPSSHAVYRKDYRQLRIARYPYVLIFQVRGDDRIFVTAVAHTSRRPGYWTRRK